MRHSSSAVLRPALIGLVALAAVAGCTGAAASAPPVPAGSAMAEPSAMASHAAMAEPSAMASHAAMAEPSGTAGSSAMAEPSAMASHAAMAEPSASTAVSAMVSEGQFHAVDGRASGSAALFHQANGTFTITFENFSIASLANTHVILVPNKDVLADTDIDKSAIVDLGPLKGTAGMQDFEVPASADAMTLHTVVLWDPEMAHAIAAAPLQ